MSGASVSGTPYSLPNKRSVLEHMDEVQSVPLREWVQEAQEECAVSGNAAAVEFVINPDIVQCPYDNGFRQYVRVWDELFVADEACAPYQYADNVYNRPGTEPSRNVMDFSLECCQCDNMLPPSPPSQPPRQPNPPLQPRNPTTPPSPPRPPRQPHPPRSSHPPRQPHPPRRPHPPRQPASDRVRG
ncbi:hypothetical protein PLESTB_001942500 [Pleodorina starrii]|uniref:Uncharacterized protein n=1 Tax=Pleodorina starrii TaxID=330485 RepID=A0A9W6C2K2_9CHLO|nr:hypothetical protein PLESTB_001942500 [Pleodorina starrii]